MVGDRYESSNQVMLFFIAVPGSIWNFLVCNHHDKSISMGHIFSIRW